MTILYTESFDHLNSSPYLCYKDNGYSLSTATGFTISPLAARTGPYGLRCTSASGTIGALGSRWTAGSNLVYCGFAFRLLALPSNQSVGNQLFAFSTGTSAGNPGQLIYIWIGSDGKLCMNNGATQLVTGSAALTLNQWYYVELKGKLVTTSSCALGDIEVRVDSGSGPTVICQIPANNPTGGGTAFTSFIFGRGNTNLGTVGWPSAAPIFDVDDFYMLDGNTSPYTGYLGNCRVDCLFPSGAGASSQWTPLSGANYTNVDDPQPDTSGSYVSTTGVNYRDSYALPDLPVTPANVYSVQVNTFVYKDVSGTNTVNNSLYFPSSYYDGPTYTASAAGWSAGMTIWTNNPATTTAFTVDNVNAMEAGIKFVS